MVGATISPIVREKNLLTKDRPYSLSEEEVKRTEHLVYRSEESLPGTKPGLYESGLLYEAGNRHTRTAASESHADHGSRYVTSN